MQCYGGRILHEGREWRPDRAPRSVRAHQHPPVQGHPVQRDHYAQPAHTHQAGGCWHGGDQSIIDV